MTRKFFHSLIPIAIICAATLLVGCSKHKQKPRKPPVVTVVKTHSEKMKRQWTLIAQTVANNTVDLKARVSGFLEKRYFNEGDFVKKGSPLFQIEQDQYKIAVQRAKAEISMKKAVLENAILTFQRNARLLKTNTVSKAEYDQANANKLAAEGDLEAAKAELADAELNLGYTRITAAFDGAIGLSTYSVGNLVGSDSGTLATIVSLDPMCVEFNVSEGDFLLANKDAESRGITLKDLLSLLKITLILSDNTKYKHPGKIYFWNNKVSSSTGTILLRAYFPNPKHMLLPGQYAKVGILSSEDIQTTFIPQCAVLSDLGGKYVLAVDAKEFVVTKRVELGYTFETMVTVKKGLNPGDMVITQGIQKVRPGMKVKTVLSSETFDSETSVGKPKATVK
ncbi:MAG: efflux RND transporter periplasmic adaptor subunit [Kiritimatiellaeota bacterium]|nr:efflux RND transporter periplasmic adaptor subunit [Kiritimatiellota bacterium]